MTDDTLPDPDAPDPRIARVAGSYFEIAAAPDPTTDKFLRPYTLPGASPISNPQSPSTPTLNVDNPTQMKKAYQDLQIRPQVQQRYEKVVESMKDASAPAKPWDVAVKLPKGKLGLAVNRALNVIGAVHDLPPRATPFSVEKADLPFDRTGRYDAGRSDGLIQIDPKSPHPQMTTAHEFGHYLDNKIFSGGRYMGTKVDQEIVDAIHPILDTTTIKLIHQLQAATGKKYYSYLLSPTEIWARAYAQWIAMRSSSKSIKSELRMNIDYGLETVWSDREFSAKVAPVVERILKIKGVLP